MKELIIKAKAADEDVKVCWGSYLGRIRELNNPAQQNRAEIPCLLASAQEWYGRFL